MNSKYIFIAQICFILLTYGIKINAQSPETETSPESIIHKPFKSEAIMNDLAASNNADASINLFGNIGNNFLDSFKGNNLYYHLAAIASTALMAYAVGSTVGKYYRNIYNLKHPPANLISNIPISPQAIPIGFSFSLQF